MRRQRCLLWIAALLVMTAAGCRNERAYEMAFSPRVPATSALEKLKAEDEKVLSGYAPSGPATELIKAFTAFNQLTVAGEIGPVKMETAIRKLQETAEKMLAQDGKEGVGKLCLRLIQRFQKQLKNLAHASKSVPGSAEAILRQRPLAEPVKSAYQAFCEVGGDFLQHAFLAGLIVPAKTGLQQTPGATFFMRLAFKVRFANLFATEGSPESWLLTDFERQWYAIWVVERSETAALPRKLMAIRELQSLDPDYPHQLARGIVYFQNRRFPQALAAFEKAKNAGTKDPRLPSFVAQLKKLNLHLPGPIEAKKTRNPEQKAN